MMPFKNLYYLSCISVLILLMHGCRHKEKVRHEKINLISQEAIDTKVFDAKDQIAYRDKVDLVSAPVVFKKKSLKEMKLELLLLGIRSMQNVVQSVGVPVVSPAISFTIDRTVDSYYILERMNKKLEKNTGMSVEVQEKQAELELEIPF